MRDRSSYAFALVSVAAVFDKNGASRFAFGGIGAKPWRTPDADAAAGSGAKAVADAALTGARTTHHNDFKKKLVEQLDAYYRLWQVAPEEEKVGLLERQGIILHTSMVVVDALSVAFHEPWNRQLFAACGEQ